MKENNELINEQVLAEAIADCDSQDPGDVRDAIFAYMTALKNTPERNDLVGEEVVTTGHKRLKERFGFEESLDYKKEWLTAPGTIIKIPKDKIELNAYDAKKLLVEFDRAINAMPK